MTHGAFGYAPHSPKVDAWLQCGDRRVTLAHVGEHFVIAEEPCDLEAGEATIFMVVDDKTYQSAVYLNEGMRVGSRQTEIRPAHIAPF